MICSLRLSLLFLKDTTKFKFPLEVDMSPYCEPESVKGGAVYELYSVVIHSGSTHSGHYTAYIRDVDDLGVWTQPVSEMCVHMYMYVHGYLFSIQVCMCKTSFCR